MPRAKLHQNRSIRMEYIEHCTNGRQTDVIQKNTF